VVRKGLNAGFVVTDDRDTRNFFPLYARNMRDHGTPALPRRFFDRLLALFGGQCSILTVHHGGRPVSSVLSYHFGGRVLPDETGSRPMARALCAKDHMYWALMRRAGALGGRIFDCGRSKVDTGPFHFKRNWGFEPRPIINLFRLRPGAGLPNINPTNSRYAFFIRAWRRLPLPVANLVSPALSCSLA
jgi:FemAB-related protein (PEP-CTERM system-associated)